MANLDAPVGMWPVVGTGGSTSPRITLYQVDSGYTTRIGSGSPVIQHADGVQLWTRGGATTNGSTIILGVACNAWTSNSGTHDIFVFDDPDQRFLLQADENQITAVSIGLNFSFVSLADAVQVNTTTLRSKQELDSSTGATAFGSLTTANNRPLRLVAISGKVDKDEVSSSWTGCIVQWNPRAHIYEKDSSIGV